VDAVYQMSQMIVSDGTVVISQVQWNMGRSMCADLKLVLNKSNFKLNGQHFKFEHAHRKYSATSLLPQPYFEVETHV